MAVGRSLARWLRHSPTGRGLSSRVAAFYIRLVAATTRWEYHGRAAYEALIDSAPGGLIASSWHGRLFMAPTYAYPKRRRAVAMISNNADGELIAAIVSRFGVTAVRGSTYDKVKERDKGGAEAFQGAMHEITRNRALVAITPDGPRGPRMRAQGGAVQLAIATGTPIVPIGFSVTRGKLLRSWDRFLLPFPFSRGVVIYGEPLYPPERGGSEAAMQQAYEAALNDLQNRADDLCQRPRVEPGPPLGREG
ncbi:lysophospholipid acyltransferase family protein [Rhodobacteraceae bacterium NNCM2]|nr:lysophospholipid acyltransferase family protein [Coraliihabitans acroporae]